MKNTKKNIDSNQNLKAKTEKRAHNLMKENIPYDVLCWELAEFLLIYEKGRGLYSEHDVCQKAKEIFESSPKYEEICLLIGLYKSYLEQEHLYP